MSGRVRHRGDHFARARALGARAGRATSGVEKRGQELHEAEVSSRVWSVTELSAWPEPSRSGLEAA